MRVKLPVNHLPAGTKSWAPPLDAYWVRWLMASRNAFVFDVFPSPTPPNSISEALWALQLMALYSNDSKILPFLLSAPFSMFNKTTATITSLNIITCPRSSSLTTKIKSWNIPFLVNKEKHWINSWNYCLFRRKIRGKLKKRREKWFVLLELSCDFSWILTTPFWEMALWINFVMDDKWGYYICVCIYIYIG